MADVSIKHESPFAIGGVDFFAPNPFSAYTLAYAYIRCEGEAGSIFTITASGHTREFYKGATRESVRAFILDAFTTPLNRLPVIIAAPGDYRLRNGGRATVDEVKPNGETTTTRFSVKGRRWRQFRGKYVPRAGTTWHVSGRCTPISESPLDIVAKWEGE